MKQSHWLLCVAKNCDWSRVITPLSNLTRASLLEEWKLTAKAELNCEIYKSQISVWHHSSPLSRKAYTLPWILQELKKIHCHLIGVLNVRSALVTGEFVVLCGWWFSNQFDIVSETHFSCSAVGRELWLAILCSLLCPETDWNIRIGKQGYVFILTDFKKWCFFLNSWHQSVCQQLFWHWEKLNF